MKVETRKRTNKMNDTMDDLMYDMRRHWASIVDLEGKTYECYISEYISRADTDRGNDEEDDYETAFSCILVRLDEDHGTFFYEDEIKSIELLEEDNETEEDDED